MRLEGIRTKKVPAHYYAGMATFLVALGLLLFTVVDIRRGFLFSAYFQVGAPSALLYLARPQALLILVSGLGLWLAYRRMTALEKGIRGDGVSLGFLARVAAVVIGSFLVVDLFLYRGVPAARFLAAGSMGAGPGPMGLGRAIPVAAWPGWLQPAGEGVNYLLLVWHATIVGVLLGGLFLVAGAGLVTRLKGEGIIAHLTGSAMALGQPFCSCCAAPIGSALYRRGAGAGPVLAFTVSAPMLNITSLVLAAALLPPGFAFLRIVGGVIVAVFVTYGVSRLSGKWLAGEVPGKTSGRLLEWSAKVVTAYGRLFHFERLFSEKSLDSPVAFISSWVGAAWRLAKVVAPVLAAGSILAVYVAQAIPDTENGIAGVAMTSFFATLLMVPTWTEIPFAMALINKGFTGIAAAALVTLPAVSLPCLIIIAGAFRSLKAVALQAIAVFIAGIVAGIIFL